MVECFLSLVLLLGSSTDQGGKTTRLVVTVVDEAGAVLPGAEVSAETKSVVSMVSTGPNGTAVLTIAPGIYSVRVKLSGFVTVLRSRLTLSEEADAAIRVTMRLDTGTMITIACPIPFRELDPHTTVIGPIQLKTLPLHRDLASIVNLAPGVSLGR